MRKIAIVSFQGEMPCFVHALLNVWNYYERGYDSALIIEGASTKLLGQIRTPPKASFGRRLRMRDWSNRYVKPARLNGHPERLRSKGSP